MTTDQSSEQTYRQNACYHRAIKLALEALRTGHDKVQRPDTARAILERALHDA